MVCLATGPSLTPEDVTYCRGKARVIAVNDAYRLAPWADALYGSDASWWHRVNAVPEFTGARWSVDVNWGNLAGRFPDVRLLKDGGISGLDTNPSRLRNGRNSGYAAVNLALHYGARRVVLLGYDMGFRTPKHKHFFGNHPGSLDQGSPYGDFIEAFKSMVAPAKALGLDIINCTVTTALACFPQRPLREVLL